jgi:hypothetical protein
MVLTIPDPNNNSRLEVTLQDIGFDTLTFESMRDYRNVTIGEIKLNNTNMIVQSKFDVPESVYTDVDGRKTGIQQQFQIWKKGNTSSVPVFKASISEIPSKD